jgi:2'-5' RNA ligase
LSPGPERTRSARFFFALWPGKSAREELAEWSRELHAVCGGRAPQPQDLHLTLAFVGTVPPERIGDLERAAAEATPRAGALVLDRPGFWKHNRIAWAGASTVPAELESQVRDLRGALSRNGIACDAKGFVPHVTLLRDAREPRAMPALDPIRLDFGGFVLAWSSPRAGGARYEILRSW